ncbi:uncharacterized protein LOC129588814 [Paramacrobiotus metropolitanus]|uniref:uncharacterized protein LOC129588814 n=1 Tax=Paramacrobiotus metropolitanus TaxID=2943436 RepID=UPI00244574D1|nr:uncharacterized protein LOC129588814 [Paramacrobiotus metropolitanus]
MSTMSPVTVCLLVLTAVTAATAIAANNDAALGETYSVNANQLLLRVRSLIDRSPVSRVKRYASTDCKEIMVLAVAAFKPCKSLVDAGYTSSKCRSNRYTVYEGLAACLDETSGDDRDFLLTIYRAWRNLDL